MKNLRLLLVGLGLVALAALGTTGCFITSAQILAHYALPSPFTINGADGYETIPVDLNTVSDYKDNKDKLKDVSDLAIIGKFTNTDGTGGGVEFYISPGSPSLTSPAAIRAGATKLWGPGSIGATGTVRVLGWDDSAALFNPAGKAILINEAKGDGVFTLYAIGSAGTVNHIQVDKGFLVLVISAGL